jgi:hypothetical protein
MDSHKYYDSAANFVGGYYIVPILAGHSAGNAFGRLHIDSEVGLGSAGSNSLGSAIFILDATHTTLATARESYAGLLIPTPTMRSTLGITYAALMGDKIVLGAYSSGSGNYVVTGDAYMMVERVA